VHLEAFDQERNIHSCYTIGARFVPGPDDRDLAPCESSSAHYYGLTPERGVGNPYPLYVSLGCLFLRRDIATQYPEIERVVKEMVTQNGGFLNTAPSLAANGDLVDAVSKLGVEQDVLRFLVDEYILDQTETGYHWRYRLQSTSIIEVEDDIV
jgi:hypothetical protein